MPQPPILELTPNWGATERYKTDVYELELGDNYKQIMGGGTQPRSQSWEITYNGLSFVQVEAIVSQLKTFAGVTGFQWRPNDSIPYNVYTCTSPQVTPIADDLWQISCTFEELKGAQCVKFLNFIDEAKIILWLDELDAWFTRFTRNTLPLILNTVGGQPYMTVNSFHDVLGRGGYFPSSANSTEAQFLLIRACMLAYERTGNYSWYNRGLQMTRSLEPVFYGGQTVPTNTNTLWVPHWLVNVKYAFTSKGKVKPGKFLNYGYFDQVVNFTNGVGRIPQGSPADGDLVSNVYTVYPVGARLLWNNVFAPVIFGAAVPIDYWVSNYLLSGQRFRIFPGTEASAGTTPIATTDAIGTIKLKGSGANFTGQLKVCYSAYSGPNIPVNTRFDAYPMWRALQAGEINAAFDSLFWADRCYGDLYRLTLDPKWQRAQLANKYSTLLTADIPNLTNWYKEEDNDFPFSYPGSQVILANNTNVPGFTADRVTSGALQNGIKIDVTAPIATNNYPVAEFQNFAVSAKIGAGTTVKAKFAIDQSALIEVSLSTTADSFDLTQTYTAHWLVNGGSSGWTQRTFLPLDFYRWRSDKEYLVWHPTIAESPLYSYSGGGGSDSVTRLQVSVTENGKDYSPVIYQLNLNPGSGYAGGGLVMIGVKPTTPPLIRYRMLQNPATMRITDASGNIFTKTIDRTDTGTTAADWKEVQFEWNDFAGTGSPDDSNPIQAIEIQAQTGKACAFQIHWAAINSRNKPERLPVPVQTYKAALTTRLRGNYTFYVGDFRPIGSPSDDLPYKGVVPYTVNTIAGNIDSWRGIPITGYQMFAYQYYQWGQTDYLNNVLQFLADAQSAYAKQNANGTIGIFAQSYSWNRWDAGDFLTNGVNTFGFESP